MLNKYIKSDLLAVGAKEASFKRFAIHFLTRPEFKAVVYYRLYSRWYKKGGLFYRTLSKILWLKTVKNTGCYISPMAKTGAGFRLAHATGIVVGDGVVIGKNVCLYQNVTIGKNKGEAYPVIEDGVTIYAGACVIGNITIGKNSIIGANSVVNKDTPHDSVAVGVPAKVLNK